MTWEGWAYLATVIDLASRRVVGWALADHMRTELVEDALQMAFVTRRPDKAVIVHSDRASQYTRLDYGKLARANGVAVSVGMAGECWDNAVAASFFATIKRELIDTRAWPTRAGLRAAVFDYIEGWYNTRRLRSAIAARPSTKQPSTTTPTVRRHDQHNQPVRRSGPTPGHPQKGHLSRSGTRQAQERRHLRRLLAGQKGVPPLRPSAQARVADRDWGDRWGHSTFGKGPARFAWLPMGPQRRRGNLEDSGATQQRRLSRTT
jgi:hypothetical protein